MRSITDAALLNNAVSPERTTEPGSRNLIVLNKSEEKNKELGVKNSRHFIPADRVKRIEELYDNLFNVHTNTWEFEVNGEIDVFISIYRKALTEY